MDITIIKQMVEDGFSCSRIADKLKLSKKKVQDIILENAFILKHDIFSDTKIPEIIKLYELGVSAKVLGFKYHIDKRRVQKWAKERGNLRSLSDSHRVTYFNQHSFDVIDIPAKAYWLGFFYADAYNADLQKLAKLVELPIEKVEFGADSEGYETCKIALYSKHFCTKMTELGCMRAKSFKIEFPKWLDKNLYSHFVRGMFDGDGSLKVNKNTGEWAWNLVSTESCCIDLANIFKDELNLNIDYGNISKTGNNTCNLVTNGHRKIRILLDWLYKDSDETMRLDRKYEKYQTFLSSQNRPKNKFIRKVDAIMESNILYDLSLNMYAKDVADKYGIHPRTVTKILANNKNKLSVVIPINL